MTTAALAEFCQIIQGGRLRLSGNDFVPSGFPAYGAGGLNGYLQIAEFSRPGIVLSSIGARCGKCFLPDGPWTSLANTQVIFPSETVADSKFLWFQLNDETRWPRSGSAQPFIKPTDVKRHRVFLPALNEQRRIAAILDEADALRRKRREAIDLVCALPQAMLVELLKSVRTSKNKMSKKALIELVLEGDTINYGVVQPGDEVDNGVGLVRVANVVQNDFRVESMKRIDKLIESQYTRSRLRGDEILIACVGSIGALAIPPATLRGVNIARAVARIPYDPIRVNKQYLFSYLRSDTCQRYFHAETRTVAQPTLNIKQLSETPIELPDMKEQARFGAEIDELNKTTESLELHLSYLDSLFASLQHRAFRGKL